MSNLSKKAIKERKYRKRENDRKHFEKPLRAFIEHKYQTIFEEYQQLYDLMVTNHPHKRNLTNTKTFKEWIRTNEGNPKTSDILSVAITETLGECVTGEQSDVASLESEQSVASLESEQSVASLESEQSVASLESEQFVASLESGGVPANDIADIERQIDQIVNELMLEGEVRDALESENEDEGIGINVLDEIAFDIEPFDYELEVDDDW